MNLNKTFLILFVLAAFNIYSQECKSKITIRTDVKASVIYIDNNFIGNGSISVELMQGRHDIFVMEAPGRWDSGSLHDTLNIQDCNDTTIVFSFTRQVYLNTDPQDAYVYHDSVLIGHTPLFLPLNTTEITLKKPGYDTKVVAPSGLAGNQKIKLNFTGERKGESFFEQNIFKVVLGGIVALGGATAYFKLKADDNFDQYLLTGDENYLDRTHKFDLISGITFGAVQLGLGFLIYHFLSE